MCRLMLVLSGLPWSGLRMSKTCNAVVVNDQVEPCGKPATVSLQYELPFRTEEHHYCEEHEKGHLLFGRIVVPNVRQL